MRVGRFFGVRLVLNPYFLAVLAFMGAAGLLGEALLLFAVVFLHELGHVIAAKRSGLEVVEVELLPFGGVARIDDLLEFDRIVEVWVAVAGPMTNALLVAFGLAASPHLNIPAEWSGMFVRANLLIGGFNLLPALPLDGGRVLRALLSKRSGFRKATASAARISRACAALLFLLGIALLASGAASVSMIVVSIFLFVNARKEERQASYAFLRHLVHKRMRLRSVRSFSCRHIAAAADASVKEVVSQFAADRYHVVWVLDREGGVAGYASEADVIDALFERGINASIGSISRPIGQSGEAPCDRAR